jgi:DNA-binding NarL/FixJ family response regulator
MMLTMRENPDYLLQALKAGAAGYVLKDASQEEIIEAVRRVRNGESPMDSELAAPASCAGWPTRGRCAAEERAVLTGLLTQWIP